jgi:predicted small secreted protein
MTYTARHVTIGMRAPFPRLLVLIVLAAGVAALAACSTTEGFGKDVKNLGGGIEGSAARNK